MNVVITGTSRGIGHELTHQALKKGHRVLAVARDPRRCQDLGGQIETLALDLTEETAAEKIARAVEGWGSVDVLINNAGIYRAETGTQRFLESFHVNTVVPFQVTTALLPHLKKAKAAKVTHITSLMGSIADNTSGGFYPYRASKAALNMVNKSLSIDQPWLTTIVMHPGWVQTDMGGSQAPTTVAESAAGIWSVIEKVRPEDSGAFFDFRGERKPW